MITPWKTGRRNLSLVLPIFMSGTFSFGGIGFADESTRTLRTGDTSVIINKGLNEFFSITRPEASDPSQLPGEAPVIRSESLSGAFAGSSSPGAGPIVSEFGTSDGYIDYKAAKPFQLPGFDFIPSTAESQPIWGQTVAPTDINTNQQLKSGYIVKGAEGTGVTRPAFLPAPAS